jgi:hypothetical protein
LRSGLHAASIQQASGVLPVGSSCSFPAERRLKIIAASISRFLASRDCTHKAFFQYDMSGGQTIIEKDDGYAETD